MSGEQQAEIPPALSEKTRVISFAHVPIQGGTLPLVTQKIRVSRLRRTMCGKVSDLQMDLKSDLGLRPPLGV